MAVLFDQELQNWIDRDLEDSDGQTMGKVEGLYYDEATGNAEWLLIKTGLFGAKKSLVPTYLVRAGGDHLMASFTKDHLDDALMIEGDETPTEEQQRFLYRFWGLAYKPLGPLWRP